MHKAIPQALMLTVSSQPAFLGYSFECSEVLKGGSPFGGVLFKMH